MHSVFCLILAAFATASADQYHNVDVAGYDEMIDDYLDAFNEMLYRNLKLHAYFDNFSGITNDDAEFLEEFLGSLGKKIRNAGKKIKKKVKKAAKKVKRKIRKTAKKAKKKFKKAVKKAKRVKKKVIKKAKKIRNKIKRAAKLVKRKAVNTGKRIRSKMKNAVIRLKKLGRRIKHKVKTLGPKAKKLLKRICSKVKDKLMKIKTAAKKGWDKWKDKVRKMKKVAKKGLKKFGVFTRKLGNKAAELAVPRIVKTVGTGYVTYLKIAGHTKGYKKLPYPLVEAAQKYYNVDLSKVRYATGVNTLHGKAITMGNTIYFPHDIDMKNNPLELLWMLHELQHVEQFKKEGGVQPFLNKYYTQAAQQVIKQGKVDVHGSLSYEIESDKKACDAMKYVWPVYGDGKIIKLHCDKGVHGH